MSMIQSKLITQVQHIKNVYLTIFIEIHIKAYYIT